MSLLYSLVFSSRCRSTHHKLAIDALRHLKGPAAATWRTFFLHHHEAYLKGAKAPDEEFKDFKNHVLHVREGEWGGALESAEEWRLRTTRALAAGEWAHAARCAGVMTHYIADPHQPFHTHQTEEEGVIHRAVEWSFNKSYEDFQRIIENDLGGYPDLSLSAGEGWLSDLVRAGANESTQSYELVISHYDFAKGVKEPKAGLDQEIKDRIAPLVGRAAIAIARSLDRITADSGATPPNYGENIQAFLMALDAPIQAILKKMENAGERTLVASMYEEFRRTGKVRETLPEDDRAVRTMYAEEVAKVSLSSLDAKWPKEIGAAHGEGAKPRAARKSKAVAKPAKRVTAAPARKVAAKPVAKPEPGPTPPLAPTRAPIAASVAPPPPTPE